MTPSGQPGTRHSTTEFTVKLTWAEREQVAKAIDAGKLDDAVDAATLWTLYAALMGRR